MRACALLVTSEVVAPLHPAPCGREMQLRRLAGRCPPRGLIPLGAARREIVAPTLRRFAGRCPPRGLIPLGAARREIVAPTLRRRAGR